MAIVPDTHDFPTGAATSTEANAYIRDPIRFLLNRPIVRMRQIVAQSIPASTFTAVTFTAHDVDSAGGHSTAVNTSRYTAQYAGWYRPSGGVGYVASAVGRRISTWAVNGANINGGQTAVPTTAALDCQIGARAELIQLTQGDYAELITYQESGGALLTIVTAGAQSTANLVWESK